MQFHSEDSSFSFENISLEKLLTGLFTVNVDHASILISSIRHFLTSLNSFTLSVNNHFNNVSLN